MEKTYITEQVAEITEDAAFARYFAAVISEKSFQNCYNSLVSAGHSEIESLREAFRQSQGATVDKLAKSRDAISYIARESYNAIRA